MANILLSGSISTTGTSILGRGPAVFTTNANHTLTVDEYTNKFLNVTSSSSLTTIFNLIAPLVQGQEFVVQNNTTGGQAIQIIGSSGTGVTIVNGDSVSVVCDGNNYLQSTGKSVYTNINVLTTPTTIGTTIAGSTVSLPQAIINVVSTTSFPSRGNIVILVTIGGLVIPQNITYTGTSPTTFTGCTGGTGSIISGDPVDIPYVVDSGGPDSVIVANTALGIYYVTLPPITNGRTITVKDSGSASPTNPVTILSAPSQYIGSSTTNAYVISAPAVSVTLIGSTALSPNRWFVI
jgi:hypothetical protein